MSYCYSFRTASLHGPRHALFALAAALITCAAGGPLAVAQPAETGVWYDDTGKGAVRIEPCADRMCGYIHWLEPATTADGRPLRDVHNPDPALQTNGICGLQVLGDLVPQPDGALGGGWVYDPKAGKRYRVEIKARDADTLTVRGYLTIKALGRVFEWKRAPATLPPCTIPPPG
ncbi:MAG: DUF2147 domain-containing protein [Hyphomicrobiaceae bacterium]|nr:DUF2147 domain-containing protein [Hyphomicrobiaceae bacterium]